MKNKEAFNDNSNSSNSKYVSFLYQISKINNISLKKDDLFNARVIYIKKVRKTQDYIKYIGAINEAEDNQKPKIYK